MKQYQTVIKSGNEMGGHPRKTVIQSDNGTNCGKAEEGSFPRVLNVLPREKIEGPPRDLLKANPRPRPRPDQRPKPEGPQAPRVFGLWSGRGCGQGFAFTKSRRGPSIFFRGSTLSTQGTFPGAPFTMIPPRLSHRFSFFLPNALLYYVKFEK